VAFDARLQLQHATLQQPTGGTKPHIRQNVHATQAEGEKRLLVVLLDNMQHAAGRYVTLKCSMRLGCGLGAKLCLQRSSNNVETTIPTCCCASQPSTRTSVRAAAQVSGAPHAVV
jgi:hypothetical protein